MRISSERTVKHVNMQTRERASERFGERLAREVANWQVSGLVSGWRDEAR